MSNNYAEKRCFLTEVQRLMNPADGLSQSSIAHEAANARVPRKLQADSMTDKNGMLHDYH